MKHTAFLRLTLNCEVWIRVIIFGGVTLFQFFRLFFPFLFSLIVKYYFQITLILLWRLFHFNEKFFVTPMFVVDLECNRARLK